MFRVRVEWLVRPEVLARKAREGLLARLVRWESVVCRGRLVQLERPD